LPLALLAKEKHCWSSWTLNWSPYVAMCKATSSNSGPTSPKLPLASTPSASLRDQIRSTTAGQTRSSSLQCKVILCFANAFQRISRV
jgi:hypothetical protein